MAEDENNNTSITNEERDRRFREQKQKEKELSAFSNIVKNLSKKTQEGSRELAMKPVDLVKDTVKSVYQSIPLLSGSVDFMKELTERDDQPMSLEPEDDGESEKAAQATVEKVDSLGVTVGRISEASMLTNDLLRSMLGVWDEQELRRIEDEFERQRQNEILLEKMDENTDALEGIEKLGGDDEGDTDVRGRAGRFGGLLKGVAKGLALGLPALLGGMKLFEGFTDLEGVLGIDPEMVSGIGEVALRVVSAFKNLGDSILGLIDDLFGFDVSGMLRMGMTNLIEGIANGIDSLVSFFSEDVPNFFTEQIPNMFRDMIVGLAQWVNDVIPGFNPIDVDALMATETPDIQSEQTQEQQLNERDRLRDRQEALEQAGRSLAPEDQQRLQELERRLGSQSVEATTGADTTRTRAYERLNEGEKKEDQAKQIANVVYNNVNQSTVTNNKQDTNVVTGVSVRNKTFRSKNADMDAI